MFKTMRKHPILIFFGVVAILIASAAFYIQSAAFANQLKRVMAKYVPRNLGVSADFTHLSIRLFPPGLGVVNPRIDAAEGNSANIPPNTKIEAERMDLSFRPLQILSGRVSLHEVRIVNGKVTTSIIPLMSKKKKTLGLSWDDLFDIQTERVVLENTSVDLDLPTLKSHTNFNAKSVEIEKNSDQNGTFYDVLVHLGELEVAAPDGFPYPTTVDSLRVAARVAAAGVELREFELVREGTQAVASGTVTGDLLLGKGLKADLELRLQGDLGRMLDFLAKGKNRVSLPQGHIAFDGRAKMHLDRVPETLSASGTLKAENLHYRAYTFDRVEIEGSYTAPTAGEGDEIIVKRAVIESDEAPKRGGRQPGTGGRVEFGSFRFDLNKPTPVETTLVLKRAHVLWLGAEILKELYALDGRISGGAKVRFTPPTPSAPFSLQAEVDWTMDGLQIDNQRYGQEKKLNRIIHVKQSALTGTVHVDPSRVRFEKMNIGIQNTKLMAEGEIGIVNGSTTYEITGGGPVDLKEFGILAENPIEGTGALAIRVHGPAAAVKIDFDGSLQNFKYLRLAFGDFRGRVTWDDQPSALLLRNLDCNQGRTRYRVDGRLDLGAVEKMDFQVEVPNGGNINDFVSIFHELTKGYGWFPQGVTGAMSGRMRVFGGISLDEMQVEAAIDGVRWEYYGERFSKVRLEGGYDRGRFYLSNFDGVKRQGRVFGAVSVDAAGRYEWKLSTENFTLSDLDRIASLDIPLRGALNGTSQGKGPTGAVESKTDIRLTNLVLRGKRMGDSALVVETKSGRAKVEGSALGGQAAIKALYDFTLGRESFFEVTSTKFDFTPAILLLNPDLMQDPELAGQVSGNYRLEFLSGQAELGTGQATITDYALKKNGASFRLDRPYGFRIDRGSFTIPALALVGDEGTATFSLRAAGGKIGGQVRGKLDLSIAEFFTSAVEKSEGVAELNLAVGGTLKEPVLTGSGDVKEGMVRVRGIETPIENIRGPFHVENGVLTLSGLDSDLASGRATMAGTMEFFWTKWPTLDFSLGLNGNKLKVYPFQVAKVRGKVEIKGDTRPYLVSGKVLLENAISREKIASARGPGLRTLQYLPTPTSSSTTSFPLFRLDIAVSAPGNIIVQNELMDVEAKGDLRIVGPIDNPRPLGTATAVQGKILFKDRTFIIQSGKMEFDNPTTINPRFEVLASTEVANRRILLFATGRFDNQRIEFSSNPPMPEPEILNLLALGVTGDETRKFRSTDRSAYEQGEAASLVLHSLDFNREVQNKTGFQIGVDEAFDDRTGTSAFARPSAGDSATAPKLVIRRQFGKRFGVSAGSTVGVGNSTQREVNAEVKVTRGLSVIGVWDSIEGVAVEDPKRNSIGLDVKVQKRFK